LLRVYHLLIGLILLALAPFILQSFFKKPNDKNVQPRPTQSQSSSQAVKATAAISTSNPLPTPVGNVWKSMLGKANTPVGWNVAPCNGDAPLLCISSNGKNLGSVEMDIYPLSKQPKFQKMLNAAGIPTAVQVDYQDPNYQEKIASALNNWVIDEYTIISKDRQNSYTNKINFSGYPPQKVTFGKLQGIRYGFIGIYKEGGVKEQHLKYAAFDGNALYIINTAYDPAAPTGKFDKHENLAAFEPFLGAIASNLKLPQ
jgi:hypothetical protein